MSQEQFNNQYCIQYIKLYYILLSKSQYLFFNEQNPRLNFINNFSFLNL